MKMMPGGHNLCCHNRFAGLSFALGRGTIPWGGGGGLLTRRHGTIYVCTPTIYLIYPIKNVYMYIYIYICIGFY